MSRTAAVDKAKTPLPKVSVLERRLAHPFGAPSVAMTLRTAGTWAIRVINTGVRSGRLHDVTANKGWTYVEADELDGRPDEYGFRVLDGRLVRGEHGEEVLVKMPQANYDAIQRAKADLNLKGLGKKDDVAQRTAQVFGDEAGDTVADRITVTDSRERVELEDAEGA